MNLSATATATGEGEHRGFGTMEVVSCPTKTMAEVRGTYSYLTAKYGSRLLRLTLAKRTALDVGLGWLDQRSPRAEQETLVRAGDRYLVT